ncbi:hypothetical protein P7V88_005239 [Salmonella enterica]|nr:hypothetical protein [Salmonella enterica]
MTTFKPDQHRISSYHAYDAANRRGIHGVEKAAEEFICLNNKQMPLLM